MSSDCLPTPESYRPIGAFDYVYTPSRDVARDSAYLVSVLGAEFVFAIDEMGTRVAMVRFTPEPPAIVLADHLDGVTPVLVYRVERLDAAMSELESRGWQRGRLLELPMGPACSFSPPGGQRMVVLMPRLVAAPIAHNDAYGWLLSHANQP